MPQWLIERKIPIAFIFSLLMELMLLVSWATYLEARVETLEAHAQDVSPLVAGMARLEERVIAVKGDIAVIRREVERLGEGMGRKDQK